MVCSPGPPDRLSRPGRVAAPIRSPGPPDPLPRPASHPIHWPPRPLRRRRAGGGGANQRRPGAAAAAAGGLSSCCCRCGRAVASAAPPPKYLAAPDLYASGAGAGGECANLGSCAPCVGADSAPCRHLEVVGVRARQRTRLCLFSQMRGVGRDVKAREAMHLGQGNICISDKGISEVRKHTVMGCRDIKRWRSNGLRSIDLKFWGSAVRLRSYCE